MEATNQLISFDCITGTKEYIKNQESNLKADNYICNIQQISKDWYSLKFWK
jgi:hypothetical protein